MKQNKLPEDIREKKDKMQPKEVSMLDLILKVRELEAANFGLRHEIKQQAATIKELLELVEHLHDELWIQGSINSSMTRETSLEQLLNKHKP